MTQTNNTQTTANDTGMELLPTPGRIAVRPPPAEQVTEAGIYLLDSGKEKPILGEVVAVCGEYEYDGEQYEPLFSVGEWVLFGRYSGTEFQIGRDKLIILRENDVLGRIRGKTSAKQIKKVVKLHD